VATDPRSDAINKYYGLGKYAPKPAPTPTVAATNAAGDRRYDAYNKAYGLGEYAPAAPTPGADQPGVVDQTDWSSYLGLYGLPADVQKELNAIFQRTPDVTQATQLALAYVRGTAWYGMTYPGIQEAIAKGIVRNEADYRAQFNDWDQMTRQWTNRPLASNEFADYLKEGVSRDTVAKRYEGAALANTYGNDWRYYSGAFGTGRMSDAQTGTLGQQEAGLGSSEGIGLQKMIQDARTKLARAFDGVLATGPLQGIGEAQQRAQTPDIGR
jgi:hypothetical protein